MAKLQSNQPLADLTPAWQARLRSAALLYLVCARDWGQVGELLGSRPETLRGWFNGAFPTAAEEAMAEAAERYEVIREAEAAELVSLAQYTLRKQMLHGETGRTKTSAANFAWQNDLRERDLVEKYKAVLPLEAVNELMRRAVALALTYIPEESRDEYVRHAQSLTAPGA